MRWYWIAEKFNIANLNEASKPNFPGVFNVRQNSQSAWSHIDAAKHQSAGWGVFSPSPTCGAQRGLWKTSGWRNVLSMSLSSWRHDVTQCSDWLAPWRYDSRYSSGWLRRREWGSDTVQIGANESQRWWVSELLCYGAVQNPTKKWRGFNGTEFSPQLIRFLKRKRALLLISTTVTALKCFKRIRMPGYLKAGC